jgi:low temperature requirement protein LtrA
MDDEHLAPHLTEGDEETVEHRVKSLELYFDLVFVLAFTQVTTKLGQDLTWHGLFRSLLVLAVLWWAWAGYAWLTNAFDPESKLLRLPIFLAMAGMLVCALAVPEAFGKYAAIFAVAYLVVRLIHVSFYLIGARGIPDYQKAVMRMSPSFIAAPLLLVASVPFDGTTQAAIWVLAIVVDYGGAYVLGGEGWDVEPEHFAERFGLIVIIALGESIVSIGVGADGVELDARTIIAAVLAITLASSMWWMYFDVVALVAARKLEEMKGVDRTRLARDDRPSRGTLERDPGRRARPGPRALLRGLGGAAQTRHRAMELAPTDRRGYRLGDDPCVQGDTRARVSRHLGRDPDSVGRSRVRDLQGHAGAYPLRSGLVAEGVVLRAVELHQLFLHVAPLLRSRGLEAAPIAVGLKLPGV